jgi:hypothetical protein
MLSERDQDFNSSANWVELWGYLWLCRKGNDRNARLDLLKGVL